MLEDFTAAGLGHVAGAPTAGRAAYSVLTEQDFAAACAEIMAWEGYAATPMLSLAGLAGQIGIGRIDYKHEGPRFGLGSFKALGGAYAALRILQRELGRQLARPVRLEEIRAGNYARACAEVTLVSATAGNHGRSLAWGCQRFGAPCRIYIHAGVDADREEAMRALGAEVIRTAGGYDDSVLQARHDAGENGWHVVSDTSWPGYCEPPRDVMAGYGVMTREICENLEQPPTHVFLQGGVGGLAASAAAGLRQHFGALAPRVVIVEPEQAACLFESARNGKAVEIAITKETRMGGLSCGAPSELAWEVLREEAADFVTIPDNIVAPAMRMLAHPMRDDPAVDAGDSAVAGLAALIAARLDPQLSSALGLDGDSRVLLIGSEGGAGAAA